MDVKETFENVKEKAEELLKNEDPKKQVKDVLDKTDIDDKIIDKVKGVAGGLTGGKK